MSQETRAETSIFLGVIPPDLLLQKKGVYTEIKNQIFLRKNAAGDKKCSELREKLKKEGEIMLPLKIQKKCYGT